MNQRADKSGNRDGAYFAATWHIPLEALLQYSKRKSTSLKAHFPYYMSKSNGELYQCDDSLVVKRDQVSGITDEKYYYLAPIRTKEKFEEELLTRYTTPSKTGPSDGSHSVSTRSQTDSRNSGANDTSRISSLTDAEGCEHVPSAQSNVKQKIVDSVTELFESSKIDCSTMEGLIRKTLELANIADNEHQNAENANLLLKTSKLSLERVVAAHEEYKARTSSALCGYHLTDDEWHRKHPKACKQYFLFHDFSELKHYLGAFWPFYFGDTVPEAKRFASSLPGTKLTHFERCLITMMRLHGSGERLCALATIWNRSERSIRYALKQWIPRFEKIGNMLCILDIPEEYLTASCPQPFKDAKIDKVAGLVDGKAIMTAENRKNAVLKRASYSEKVDHGAATLLQFCTPSGLNFDHSPVMLGRASETMMVKHMALNSSPLKETFISDDGTEFVREWPRRLAKILKGWLMLVDRGFAKHVIFYPNHNPHLFPSFLRGRAQFTKEERGKDKSLCRLRWVNEANFARMLYVRCLKDIVGWPFIPLIPAAVSWGLGICNLQQPFHKSQKDPEAEKEDNEDMSVADDEEEQSGGSDSDSMCCSSDDDDGDASTGASSRSNKRQYSPDRIGGGVRAAFGGLFQRARNW